MKTEFKIGDRVAVYAWDGRYTGEITEICYEHGYVGVQCSDILYRRAHPKQLRRLRPRKERRRIWVNPRFLDMGCAQVTFDESNALVMSKREGLCCVEFIEVKK